jgi:serine phosphatase RsbU (regulator of sigma subunit)/putative methionine-R-sulfoxide reductase with GAF domain
MSQRLRVNVRRWREPLIAVYSFAVGLLGWLFLVRSTPWGALRAGLGLVLLFVLLSCILKHLGFRVDRDVTHSLVGIVDLAAVFVFGPPLGAWVAGLSGLVYLSLRAAYHRFGPGAVSPALDWKSAIELPLFSSGLKALMALCCGGLYLRLGGKTAPTTTTWPMFTALVATLVVWFLMDHLAWGGRAFLRGGRSGLIDFIRRIGTYSLLVELAPLPLSIVVALTFASLGGPAFLLLALALIASASMLQSLTRAWDRLAVRASELEQLYRAEQEKSKQIAAISEVAQRVAAILELDTLFAQVVDLIKSTFSYDHVGIFTVDDESGEVAFRASTSPVIRERGLHIARGEGMISWVAEHGEPILANDVSQEARFCFDEALVDTRAELAVPLKVEQRIVGVLDVQSNRVGAFGDDDMAVLRTLAAPVAVAIQAARLYAARQEEAWTSTVLLQVAEAVGNLTSLRDMLETITRITPLLVGVDRCTVLLLDEQLTGFTAAGSFTRHAGVGPLFDGLHFQPGDVPLLDQLRASGSTLIMEGQANTRLIPEDLLKAFQVGSLLALPLRFQGETYGAMLVDYVDVTVRFTERKKAILTGVADQSAMAIANARLHDAQHEEAWVSAALLQVAQALVSSADLSENLAKIVRLTPLLAGVDRCMIFLWEQSTQAFVPYNSHGLSKDQLAVYHEMRFRSGEMPLLDRIRQSKGRVTVETEAESALIPVSVQQQFQVRSMLGVPLVSKQELLGALLVDYTQRASAFSPRRISIVEGIAHQAAIAIENARLYETVLQQERMSQELRLARDIQVSFLPDSCPYLPGWEMAADWHSAREVGGDFYDFVPLDADRLGVVIADVSDKGVPAALFMSLARTLLRASALELRSPAETLQRVNELIMADTRSDMFVTMFYCVLNWRSGQLAYASAGHNPPVVWRQSEARAEFLHAKGVVLGVVEGISLENGQVTLDPGDTVVLYTDGVTEPINEQQEEFGEQRLVQAIAAGSAGSCTELVRLIRERVSAFVGAQAQFDDYTLVGVKRTEP